MSTLTEPIQLHRISVNILGEKYVVRGEAQPDHISEVAHIVDSRMRELRSSAGSLNKTKLAVLTALNLADELLQLKKDQEDSPEARAVAERTKQLITLLDEGLIGDTLY